MFGFRKRRHRRLRAAPTPPDWVAILERDFPYFRRLSPEDRRELLGHVRVFLREHPFEGCGGLVMTEEIRLTIAAQACLLLLHRDTDVYPLLGSVVVYPRSFVTPSYSTLADGSLVVGQGVNLGESWDRGSVVLSWEDVRHGAADPDDGQNLVFHEFAHQLDGESGAMDGLPAVPSNDRIGPWAQVLGREYRDLVEAIGRDHATLLDEYGATNPMEFFAVATETFFEKPVELRKRHPELYEQFRLFYRQDPVTRFGAVGADLGKDTDSGNPRNPDSRNPDIV
jgi:Mlc titration factor MtfA (ptsG expression regulator)